MAERTPRADELQPLSELQAKQAREYVEKLEKERVSRWDNFDEGYARSWEVSFTPELVIMFCDGVEDYNPWYDAWRTGENKSPFGPAVVPPLMMAQQCETTHFLKTKDGRASHGGMHVMHDTEFVAPCFVGTTVKITGKLVSKFEKRERRYFRLQYRIEDARTGELYCVETRENLVDPRKVTEQGGQK